MDYVTREEFYEAELHRMAKQIAEILDKRYSVEICRSRSGLKLFAVVRKHEVVRREESE